MLGCIVGVVLTAMGTQVSGETIRFGVFNPITESCVVKLSGDGIIDYMAVVYRDKEWKADLANIQAYLTVAKTPILTAIVHPQLEKNYWSFVDGNGIGFRIVDVFGPTNISPIAHNVYGQTKDYSIWWWVKDSKAPENNKEPEEWIPE